MIWFYTVTKEQNTNKYLGHFRYVNREGKTYDVQTRTKSSVASLSDAIRLMEMAASQQIRTKGLPWTPHSSSFNRVSSLEGLTVENYHGRYDCSKPAVVQQESNQDRLYELVYNSETDGFRVVKHKKPLMTQEEVQREFMAAAFLNKKERLQKLQPEDSDDSLV